MNHADKHTGRKSRDISGQSGRTAIVTGADAGLGFETALALEGAGAEVVAAARDTEKDGAAVVRIKAARPWAAVAFEVLAMA